MIYAQQDPDGLTLFKVGGFWYVLCNNDMVIAGRDRPTTTEAIKLIYRYKGLKNFQGASQ